MESKERNNPAPGDTRGLVRLNSTTEGSHTGIFLKKEKGWIYSHHYFLMADCTICRAYYSKQAECFIETNGPASLPGV